MKGRRSAILTAAIVLVAAIAIVVATRGRQEPQQAGASQGQPDAERNQAAVSSDSAAVSGKSAERASTGKQAAGPAKDLRLPELREHGMDGLERRRLISEFIAERGMEGLAQLLTAYGVGPAEKGNLTHWFYQDLEATVPAAYQAGQLGTAPEVIDLLGSAQSSSHMVEETSAKLVDKAQPEKALREVFQKPPQTKPDLYEGPFGRAGFNIGYEKALRIVDEMGSGKMPSCQ